MSEEWSLSAVADVVAAAVPDRDMLVCGDVRRTFGEVAERSRSLAAFLGGAGIGLQRERDELERWECGQDAVALVLHNGTEYLEAMLGAFRARAVPFNVNQQYRPAEIGDLFAYLGARAVVHHRALGPLVAAGCEAAGLRLDDLVLIDVDDGSGTPALAGSTPYEDAVRTPVVGSLPTTSPDDLYLVCTGGTTGRPKAVLWRQADILLSGMGGSAGATAESIAATAAASPGRPWYAVPPLMHAAAQWTAFSGLHNGAAVVVHDDSGPFDPAQILRVAERERVYLMSIVGDAYARPLVDELRRGSYDLSSLAVLGTGGAATSEHLKEALLDLVPNVTIMDGYGASETGGMAFGARTRTSRAEGFTPSTGATVVDGARQRFLEPGDEEIGWTARRGRVPLGYLGDRERTEATFPIVDGERLAIPGDRAQLLADGSIHMIGRDSMVVNTGGEKVFVEEVEAVLCRHPAVLDALVVGRPSERFGEEVVAIVATRPGVPLDPAELRAFVAADIARFKAPRAVLVCDRVHRHPSGKADYRWARSVAPDATAIT